MSSERSTVYVLCCSMITIQLRAFNNERQRLTDNDYDLTNVFGDVNLHG